MEGTKKYKLPVRELVTGLIGLCLDTTLMNILKNVCPKSPKMIIQLAQRTGIFFISLYAGNKICEFAEEKYDNAEDLINRIKEEMYNYNCTPEKIDAAEAEEENGGETKD